MKNKVVMTVYGTKKMSYSERLVFVGKGFGDPYDNSSIGYIKKFNNAIGFKKLEYDYTTHSAEVESPKEYESPYGLLITNQYFLNKDNEITTFIINWEKMVHPMPEYSYDTWEVLLKFQKYLYKLFPNDIKIEFSINDDLELEERDYVLGHFWNCIAQGENVETELALRRNLTKKDRKYILDIVREIVSYEPEIESGLCKTCFGYHPTHPYHVELVDRNYMKQELENGIEYGYYRPSFLKEQEQYLKQLRHEVLAYNYAKNSMS